jgi:broad specificity phosphatase PhoE
MDQKWPSSMVLVRHGESLLNVEKRKLKTIPTEEQGLFVTLPARDMDIPLTERGIKQAKDVGEKLKKYPRFNVAFVSPYKRAKQTAHIIFNKLGYKPKIVYDERIREKDFGMFDRFTQKGIQKYFPTEFDRKKLEGKYYYRSPGGENYPDVSLRIRSFLDTLIRDYSKERVLIVAHSVVILMFRKTLQRLSEKEVLSIDQRKDLKNCALTSFIYDERRKKLLLKEWNI